MSDAPALVASNLTKDYHTAAGPLSVLSDISLTVEPGEILAITGRSGVGKSTLLHLLGGLDHPTDGSVFIDGTDVGGLSGHDLADFRNTKIGFVFQFHHLLPEFSAIENVMMPRLIGGQSRLKARTDAEILMDRVGLADRLEHRPGQLSGGEQQRVAVARALINDPSVMLADEPSGNLDDETSQALHDVLWQVAESLKRTVIIVTHDLQLVDRADRHVRLEGRRAMELSS